jgi:hypothetical protein
VEKKTYKNPEIKAPPYINQSFHFLLFVKRDNLFNSCMSEDNSLAFQPISVNLGKFKKNNLK